MAFGSFQGADRNQAMSEINMVPLIDIVLVLLVLFILAAPMAAQSVKISLPATAAVPQNKLKYWTFNSGPMGWQSIHLAIFLKSQTLRLQKLSPLRRTESFESGATKMCAMST